MASVKLLLIKIYCTICFSDFTKGKDLYSRKENISVSAFLILCSHYTIVTTEKELKNSVIVMRINSNFKNANFTIFWKCRKMRILLKFNRRYKKKLVTDNSNISVIVASKGHISVVNS